MTDKEKIRAEIERRRNIVNNSALQMKDVDKRNHYSEMVEEYDDILRFINSLPEEPVSNPTPNERMSKERFAEACKAACCDRNYRSHYGHTETRDDYFVDGVQWADEHPIKEPVSEELK